MKPPITGLNVISLLLISTICVNGSEGRCILSQKPPDCKLLKDSVSYHPHHSSCSLYYQCKDGQREILTCERGMLFNALSSRCVYDSAIISCDEEPICSIGETGRLKPYPRNCTLYVYCNENAEPRLSACPPGKEFSPVNLYCMYPEEAQCENCKDTTITATTVPICQEPQSCEGYVVGTLLPFPSDCSKYIYCDVNGAPILSTCLPELEFSPLLGYCTNSTNAMCPYCENPTTPTELITTTSTDTTLAVCPEVQNCNINEVGKLLPYPPDCGKFIYCNDYGVGILSKCLSGLHFGPSLGYCTTPDDADCPYCESIDTTIQKTSTTMATTIAECEPNPTCSEGDVGLNKPYPADCTLFIYCNENNEELVSKCPGDFHFSPYLLYCTNPKEANCPYCVTSTTFIPETSETIGDSTISTERITTTETLSSSTTSVISCPGPPYCDATTIGDLLPDPTNCSIYYYCNEYGEGEESICSDGLHFNPQLSVCTLPELAECILCPTTITSSSTEATSSTVAICEATPTCSIFDWGVRKPYPPDCTRYIYCDFLGVEKLRYCPTTLYFSPENFRCMVEELADCDFCIEVLESTSSSLMSTTSVTCLPYPTCSIEEVGINKPISANCSLYLYCDETGVGIESFCPTGQQFSASDQECLPEADVDCPACLSSSTDMSTDTTVVSSSTVDICSLPIVPCTDEGVLIPYPPNCSIYIYCDGSLDGQPSYCPEGEHFSPSELNCLPIASANCPKCDISTSTFSSTTEMLFTTESTTESTLSSTEASTTIDTQTTLPTCDPQPSCGPNDLGIRLPYPEDCNRYVYCINDTSWEVRKCRLNLHFSKLLGTCILQSLSGCVLCEPAITTLPEESTTTDLSTIADGCAPMPNCDGMLDAGLTKPYPPDCTKYIYCNFNTIQILSCPSGEHYSPIRFKCEPIAIAECPMCV